MPFIDPNGPHAVGSIECELVDGTRPEHLAADAAGRRLFVKAWYPARAEADARRELLWEQLRGDPRTPVPMRLLLGCFRTRTSTISAARFDAAAAAPPLSVYNHGLVSFASENTSLMEHLASRGHIVLAVQHTDQLGELRALTARQPAAERGAAAQLAKRLAAAPPDEKAQLAREYYAASPNTNRIVIERSADTVFVLDHVADVLERIPGLEAGTVDASAVNLLGFSVGGAVSTETAARDDRARRVVNLDGGMHGTQDGARLAQPYLMMYSSGNTGINDTMLPRHAVRVTLPETMHLNYHDVAMLVPLLRYARATGKANATATIEVRNRRASEFLTPGASSPLGY